MSTASKILKLHLWVALMLPQVGCNASFEHVDEQQAAQTSRDAAVEKIDSSDAAPQVPSEPAETQVVIPPVAEAPAEMVEAPIVPPPEVVVVPDIKKLELSVTVSSPTVKPGNKTVLATAKLKDVVNPPAVTWSIEVPARTMNIGTIDGKGVYVSPLKNDKEFIVKVVATLIEDPTIKASAQISVLIDDAIFARCTKGNVSFPILADVYQLNPISTALPNYNDPNQARKVTTVCMENYAVAPRNFSAGFPDLAGLFEWFSLQTTTKLVILKGGDYTFQLNSDDGSKLYLNGRNIINNDGLHRAFGTGPEESLTEGRKEATLYLRPGEYDLTLNYFQGPRLRIALELKWKIPGSNSFVYVPKESFK